jgi:L-iditol 2-dehydrogenase
VVPASNVLPLPDEVDDEAAALLEPLSVAMKGCLLGGLAPGDSVLIMGAGAIGLAAVRVARALGAEPVIACDVVPEKLALVKGLGVETVLSTAGSVPGAVRELTGGRGADICLECSGHYAAFQPALESLGKGGRLVLVGTGSRDVALSGEEREQLCRRMITIRGQWMSYGPTWPGEPWTVPLGLMAEGKLDPRGMVTQRFPLEQTPEAVRFMLTPGADYLKVMIVNS